MHSFFLLLKLTRNVSCKNVIILMHWTLSQYEQKMLAKLQRGYQISFTGRKTCVPSFLSQDKGGCFYMHLKDSSLKWKWVLVCSLASRRRVCKIFLVFPSVLPMSRKLAKIDGVLGGGRISNYQTPEEGKVNSWKRKRYLCPSVFIEQRKWLTEDNTIQCSCGNIHVTYRIWFLCVYCIHKEIQSVSCHHWTIILHSCNEAME